MNWKSSFSGQIFNKTKYDHFIDIDGVNFHYREIPAKKKKAQNVFLLHGFASSTYTWEKIEMKLHESGYHVWSLDMKGFGWSDKPLNSEYDAITLMEEVNLFLEKMDIKDVIFVGNSYGGGMAMLQAYSYPSSVKKIVIIDAGAYRMRMPFILLLLRMPLAIHVAKYIFGKWMIRWIFSQVMFHKKWVTKDQIDNYYIRMKSPNALKTQVLLSKAIDFDMLEVYVDKLHEVKHETLIIWGRNDIWIPVKYGYKFSGILNNSTMAVIPACGHIPQEEKPDIVFELIDNFIKGKAIPKSFKGTL
jgi:pimeloyl-ACP methyl ester carboxylesterase